MIAITPLIISSKEVAQKQATPFPRQDLLTARNRFTPSFRGWRLNEFSIFARPPPQGPLPHAGTRGIPSDGRCRAGPLICLGRAGDACVVGALERVGDTLYGARVYVKLGRRLAHAQFSRSPPSRGPRDRVRDRGRRLSLASCVKNIWYCNSQRQRATQHLWLSVRVQRGANSAKCNSSLHRNGARPVQGLLERLTLALGILV